MTVAQLIALLQTTGIDNFGSVVFKDESGKPCNITLINIGAVTPISPSATATPGYLQIQLNAL